MTSPHRWGEHGPYATIISISKVSIFVAHVGQPLSDRNYMQEVNAKETTQTLAVRGCTFMTQT